VKIYDQYGSQPVAPYDQYLVDTMEQATRIHTVPFDEALSQGFIRGVPDRMHQGYLETYVKLYDQIHTPYPDLPVVYTPLCGCGLSTVGDVLECLGFPVLVPPDQGPDGTFAAIPFKSPNPEVPQATEPAMAFADAQGSRIVLSSDPDADRVGLEIKLVDGSWYHFDGNQIATVLCYFLMLDPRGPQRRGLVIETLVTTKILSNIVEKAGASWLVDDLLVGFKYVADVLKALETDGRYKHVCLSRRREPRRVDGTDHSRQGFYPGLHLLGDLVPEAPERGKEFIRLLHTYLRGTRRLR
jgi:phosphomannomutase